MAQGEIKWFNSEKGFGFIAPDGGGDDVFVHYSEIQAADFRTLAEGDRIEFDIGPGAKGPRAENVRALSGAPERGPDTLFQPDHQGTTAGGAGRLTGGGDGPSPSPAFDVVIYLESEEGAADVDRAVMRLLNRLGTRVAYRPRPEIGSWFRKFRAWAADGDGAALALRLERALELQVLHGPQAQIDAAQAGGAADLIRSLEGQKNAFVQLGSLLLLKVDGDLVVRNLTQRELAYIQRNPGTAANAKEILDRLQGLSVEQLRVAELEAPAGNAVLTGKVWASGVQRRLAVTNAGDVPVHNVWAAIEESAGAQGPYVPQEPSVQLLMPGQSAMLPITGNGQAQPVSVALHGEDPVGAAVKCVIRVEL